MARVVVQRVRSASVTVDGEVIARIGIGLAILVGIGREDDEASVDRLADKVAVMRIFEDENGKMNLSAHDVRGEMLVISQFTLYGDLRRGRRPSFVLAAEPERGCQLYERFAARLAAQGFPVQCGRFGAEMLVRLENDGPVTIVLDSNDL